MTSLVFRIRQRYFDAIIKGEKRTEFRRASPFWRKRIEGKGEGLNTAVFICGKRIHRRQITLIQEVETPSFFSEQGKKDVDTPTCFAIHLGYEIDNSKKCSCGKGAIGVISTGLMHQYVCQEDAKKAEEEGWAVDYTNWRLT